MFHRLLEPLLAVDLAINTLSMSEMSELQVRGYCNGISRMIGRTGNFFEQNQDNRHLGMIRACDVIAPHFRRRANAQGWWQARREPLTQGRANVWSNQFLGSALGLMARGLSAVETSR